MSNLPRGAISSSRTKAKGTLREACRAGNLRAVRSLIRDIGADVNKASKGASEGETPLLLACKNGHVCCARLLIENGADVDKVMTDDGRTPLLEACEKGHACCARLLIENGAEVNKVWTKDGSTPLLLACENGHVSCARLLIENGADVNKATTNGSSTPLLLASKNGHVCCARLLIENGADVDKLMTNDDWIPLIAACEYGQVCCARLLIVNGADVDKATTDSGWTPLLAACENGHVSCARLLIENGADIEKTTKDGSTPLLAACESGCACCARLLIENGADVDKAGHDKAGHNTAPLLSVLKRGDFNIARMLLEHNAAIGPQKCWKHFHEDADEILFEFSARRSATIGIGEWQATNARLVAHIDLLKDVCKYERTETVVVTDDSIEERPSKIARKSLDDRTALEGLREEAEKMRDETEKSTLCSVCFTNRRDTVLDCGHLVICGVCVVELRRRNRAACPFCRERFKGAILVRQP